jgi:2-methylcitrate dehydratase PrpD
VPDGITAAQLNLPFCVATLICAGEVFVDQFDAAQIVDPARLALAGRVRVVEDPAITARGGTYRHMVQVELFLKSGTRLTETVEAPRGSERQFASNAEIVDKYETLAQKVLSPARTAALRDAVLGMDALPTRDRSWPRCRSLRRASARDPSSSRPRHLLIIATAHRA